VRRRRFRAASPRYRTRPGPRYGGKQALSAASSSWSAPASCRRASPCWTQKSRNTCRLALLRPVSRPAARIAAFQARAMSTSPATARPSPRRIASANRLAASRSRRLNAARRIFARSEGSTVSLSAIVRRQPRPDGLKRGQRRLRYGKAVIRATCGRTLVRVRIGSETRGRALVFGTSRACECLDSGSILEGRQPPTTQIALPSLAASLDPECALIDRR
jgi:hypothetical protein